MRVNGLKLHNSMAESHQKIVEQMKQNSIYCMIPSIKKKQKTVVAIRDQKSGYWWGNC